MNKKLFRFRSVRRQLNYSRLRFWSGFFHWTSAPLKIKYNQLSLTLNRLAWAPGAVVQRGFFFKTTQLSLPVTNRWLFLYSLILVSGYFSFFFLCAIRPFRSFLLQLKAVGVPSYNNSLPRWLTCRAAASGSSLCMYLGATPTKYGSSNYSGIFFRPHLFITDLFFRFCAGSGLSFKFLLSTRSRNLGNRFRAAYRAKLRLKYLHFLGYGSALRVTLLLQNRRKLSSRRLPLRPYNFMQLFVSIGRANLKRKVTRFTLPCLPLWWYYTVRRGLRAPFRLGFYGFLARRAFIARTGPSIREAAPVFFLFFKLLRFRLRYVLSMSGMKSPLVWKLLLTQKDIFVRQGGVVDVPKSDHTRTQLKQSVGYRFSAKHLISVLSGGSLLPSPFISGFKRNWFTTRTHFVKASRRSFRFCLRWRAKLSFLNQRRRWLWVHCYQQRFSLFRGVRTLRLGKLPQRPFFRKEVVQFRHLLSRITHSFFGFRYGYATSPIIPSRANGLSYYSTLTLRVGHDICRGNNFYNDLRMLFKATLGRAHGTIGLIAVPKTALRSWRLLISTKVGEDSRHRKFVALRGSYVSTYFSAYINRFFEYFLGTRVGTIVNFELLARVSPIDFFFLETIKSRLFAMNSAFSTIFFINEFIDLLFLALRLRNFTHLVSYINRLLKSLVLWDHKRFFVFFFSAFREQFLPFFPELGITGLQIIIRGKIGVGGNSRKRSMALRLGVTSRTHTFINTYTFNTWLNTTTGALGFRIFLYGTAGSATRT